MAKDPEPLTVHASERVDFGGLDRLPALASRLVARPVEVPAWPQAVVAAVPRTSFLAD